MSRRGSVAQSLVEQFDVSSGGVLCLHLLYRVHRAVALFIIVVIVCLLSKGLSKRLVSCVALSCLVLSFLVLSAA